MNIIQRARINFRNRTREIVNNVGQDLRSSRVVRFFAPTAQEAANRRFRAFGTTSKTPAIITAGLIAAGGLAKTFPSTISSKFLQGLGGAAVASTLYNAATDQPLAKPNPKTYLYGAGLSLAFRPALAGIAFGEGLTGAKKLFGFAKKETKEFYDFAKPYTAEKAADVYNIYQDYAPTLPTSSDALETAQDIFSSIPQAVTSFASGITFPTLPVQVSGLPSGLGSDIGGEIRQVALALGISFAAAAALLGYALTKKKRKKYKRRKTSK